MMDVGPWRQTGHGAQGMGASLTGVDEHEGGEECDLVLGEVQGAQPMCEVEDGVDQLVAAWGEQSCQALVQPPAHAPSMGLSEISLSHVASGP